MHTNRWRKAYLKRLPTVESSYLTLWKRQNCGDSKIGGCQELGSSNADPGQQDPLWLQYTHTHRLQKSRGGKGMLRPLSQEESTRPLPWQAFIVFLGPLHQRMSSFTMQRFVLGGYPLQTKERLALNTSKEDICNVKGEMVKPAMLHTWKV